MGLFEHFPYTNYHDLNLDKILERTKEAEVAVEAAKNAALEAAKLAKASGLPYYIESTHNDTDRTSEINDILTEYGACILGDGKFVVSNIIMPAYSSLTGSGIGRTWLEPAIDASGDMIKMSSVCEVKDLRLQGGLTTAPQTLGDLNGISWAGTYESALDPGTHPVIGQIANVLISGFPGYGIICEKTSIDANSGLNADAITIRGCYCAIYVGKYSEYNKFTMIDATNNYYGCVNNGGNNIFVNCNFSLNKQALLMDDTGNISPNNSHGAFIGCAFNHPDDNTGKAIEIIGIDYAEIFSACQIHFGSINLDSCKGVRFNSCILGYDVPITVKDSKLTTFDNCTLFDGSSTVLTQSGNTALAFNECYDLDGVQYAPVI